VGDGHIIVDHGADSQPVQDDIVAVYVFHTRSCECNQCSR
jgi:hypothetical protein